MILSPIQTLDPAKVERDLAFLMRCFREVLEESGELALLPHLPWSETASPAPFDTSPERVSQAYAIAFHLLGMVEQNAAVQRQRRRRARPQRHASAVGTMSPAGPGTRRRSPSDRRGAAADAS